MGRAMAQELVPATAQGRELGSAKGWALKLD